MYRKEEGKKGRGDPMVYLYKTMGRIVQTDAKGKKEKDKRRDYYVILIMY